MEFVKGTEGGDGENEKKSLTRFHVKLSKRVRRLVERERWDIARNELGRYLIAARLWVGKISQIITGDDCMRTELLCPSGV